MRLTGLDSTIISMMSDFNADKVRRELNLTPGSASERAVLYAYRHEASPIGREANKATLWRDANIHTIQKIRRRIELHNDHVKEWSDTHDFRADALMTALIADDYLVDANTAKKDFNDGLLDDATAIRDEAMDIAKGYSPAVLSTKEGLFLAHLNTLHNLDIFYHLIEQQDHAELMDMVEDYFPDGRDFISPHYAIGREIQEYMADIEQEIFARRPTAKIYAFPTITGPR